MSDWEDVVSSSPRVCHFPKHNGTLWADVVDEDPEYVLWLISGDGPALDPDLEEYLTDLLEELT